MRIPLTRQGWWFLVLGAALIGVGRLFGVLELYVMGAGAWAIAAVACVVVKVTRIRLAIGRELSPKRVYAGNPSRVELTIRNDGERRTAVLEIYDPVSGTRGADLLVAPLAPEGVARAAYRLPTDKRGIVGVGPLEVQISDPLGLARSTTIAAPRTELTIFPHIDDIAPVPHTSGDDPHAGAEHPSSLGRSGDDFYALRQYVVGDDLRKVHWPSTARRDELMVRQDELPWQGRVTVLLDVRRSASTADSLELAVSAAASVVTASWKRRDLVRLITTAGTDFGFAAGAPHVEAIMEHLAVVGPSADGSLRGSLDVLGVTGQTGALVVVAAAVTEADLAVLSNLRSRFGQATIVLFDRSAWDGGAPLPTASSPRGVVRVAGDVPFAEAWNRAVHPGMRALAQLGGPR
ncbi:MAG: DUF58 domain-containing protein [Acidimicrobiales bacterium]